MWKRILVFCVLACGVVVLSQSDQLISRGRWIVEKSERCEDYESYPYDFNLRKKKINRTHDVFYGEMELKEDITEEDFGIYIEACKKVDGGCKHVMTFDEKNFCEFIIKHAEENFKKFLRNIGAEEHCPIPKGDYKLENFMFDNTELPDEGLAGAFIATFIIKKFEEKLICFALHLRFDEDWLN